MGSQALQVKSNGCDRNETAPEVIRLFIVTCVYIVLAWWKASRRARALRWIFGVPVASHTRLS